MSAAEPVAGAEPARTRRVLLALDVTSRADAALDDLARLAARLRAELAGLFVEDLDLLAGAGLPFTAQLHRRTAERLPLEAAEVERHMALAAGRAERRLRSTAERTRLSWSFRTVRGRLAVELASAAAEADLVVVEVARGGAGSAVPLAASLSPLAAVAVPVLVLRGGRGPASPVVVVGDEPGEPALELARMLAEPGAEPRHLGADAVTSPRHRRELRRAGTVVVAGGDPAQLAAVLRLTDGAVLHVRRAPGAQPK